MKANYTFEEDTELEKYLSNLEDPIQLEKDLLDLIKSKQSGELDITLGSYLFTRFFIANKHSKDCFDSLKNLAGRIEPIEPDYNNKLGTASRHYVDIRSQALRSAFKYLENLMQVKAQFTGCDFAFYGLQVKSKAKRKDAQLELPSSLSKIFAERDNIDILTAIKRSVSYFDTLEEEDEADMSDYRVGFLFTIDYAQEVVRVLVDKVYKISVRKIVDTTTGKLYIAPDIKEFNVQISRVFSPKNFIALYDNHLVRSIG